MKQADLIAEVRKRMPGIEDCKVRHLDDKGGYFLCVWKKSARCVHFSAPSSPWVAASGMSLESYVAASIANDLKHE